MTKPERAKDGTFCNYAGPGRPSKYTEELGDEIARRLADGESLVRICRDEHMPHDRAVRDWALNLKHPFSPKYTRAREIAYHRMADELSDIADDGANDWMKRNDPDNEGYALNGEHSSRTRLRLDTRKWMLSKMLPKIYGDKLQLAGDKENPLEIVNHIFGALNGTGRVPVEGPDHDAEDDVRGPELAS